MTRESQDVIIARIDERLHTNIELTTELLKIVKGDNGKGLVTRMAIMETHPLSCPVVNSVKWLTWAVRVIIVIPIITVLGYYFEKTIK